MQKNWRLVLLTSLGLILFFPNAFGKVIFKESKTENNFDFQNLNHVFLAITLPDNETFLNSFKTNLGTLGSLKILKGNFDEILDAMAKSSFWLFASMKITENPKITLLEVSAKASAEAMKNQANFNGIVWNRFYVLENATKAGIEETLHATTKQFLAQYYKTNPEAKGKAIFYYPDPSENAQ